MCGKRGSCVLGSDLTTGANKIFGHERQTVPVSVHMFMNCLRAVLAQICSSPLLHFVRSHTRKGFHYFSHDAN